MPGSVRPLLAALCAIGLCGPLPAAVADPPAPAPAKAPDPATAARRSSLRARATEWCDARKRLTQGLCEMCQGWGQVEEKLGKHVPCPTCNGKKTSLSRAAFRKVSYDMRSPAYRGQPRSRALAGEEYKAANVASTAPGFLRSYKLDRAELVDDTHGTAWIIENTDSVPRPSYWIFATEPTTKASTWFLYDEAADGAWAAPPPPAAPPPLEALPKLQGIAVESALTELKLAWEVNGRSKSGRTLVLYLEMGSDPPRERMDRTIRDDSITVLRAVFGAMPTDWDAVRLEFQPRWQDKFGKRTRLSYCLVSLSADVFRQIHFQNLDSADVFALFTTELPEQPGWKLVGG